jgi:hypothetical protein
MTVGKLKYKVSLTCSVGPNFDPNQATSTHFHTSKGTMIAAFLQPITSMVYVGVHRVEFCPRPNCH